ncbi:hypothetical protein [Pseudomonas sp. MWU13-3659]|uniref:hypothetical protein n=1 Tax=Pseudomonas sp. MWU13-3659 TaxID=2986964 RepID=UPI002074C1CC|nr:hypothetical protein [Pseudomonas sp. MWU13-3659]
MSSAQAAHGGQKSAARDTREEALVAAREELEPTERSELEAESAGALPNVRDVRTELAGVQRILDDLDST